MDGLVLSGFTGVLLLLLASCAPVRPDGARADNQPDPSAFADALSPPGGVPCRLGRPTYTALQRQMGIRELLYGCVRDQPGQVESTLSIVDGNGSNQELDSAAREAIVKGTCAPFMSSMVASRHRVARNPTFRNSSATSTDIVRSIIARLGFTGRIRQQSIRSRRLGAKRPYLYHRPARRFPLHRLGNVSLVGRSSGRTPAKAGHCSRLAQGCRR